MKIPNLEESYQAGRGRESREDQSGVYFWDWKEEIRKIPDKNNRENSKLMFFFCFEFVRFIRLP